ncbi:MAG: hypothetical protein IJ734_05855 [Fibrobacter sp.]|nr:hypothetical protein [Fibrobacter sp.]
MKFRPLPIIAVALYAVAFLFTGCANPTHSYLPTDIPERSKGEYVKYEGVKMQPQGTRISFESKMGDSLTMFQTTGFCYDPKNDYIVFPTTRADEGYYLIVPRDSVTLCKNGAARNNSLFSRNHLLRGLTIGTIIGGGIGTMLGIPMALFLSLFGDGSAFEAIWFTFIGVGAGTGAVIGGTVDPAIHGEIVSDIQEGCPSYYTEEEQQEYLNRNLCY